MPKIGGYNYVALYYNNEGTVNKKRNRGHLPKPAPAKTLEFIEGSMKNFSEKYGMKVKMIRMSQEMKDMIDGRVKGKAFLKGVSLDVVEEEPLGLRTIYLSEINGEKNK